MWTWILITFSFITEVQGYASGNLEASCESMEPQHSNIPPQPDEAPFMMKHSPVQKGQPVTVILSSKTAGPAFRGFLLEAREKDNINGRPFGRFILLDRSVTMHQACSGQPDSAVSHTNNHQKTSIRVNWTANGADIDITFRATFVEDYVRYWKPLDMDLIIPVTPTSTTAGTTEPSTATSTTNPSTATSTTSTTNPSTATSTTNPSTATSTCKTTKKVAIALIVVGGFSEILKMVLTSLNSHCTPTLNMVLKILVSVFCAVAEIVAVVFIHIGNFGNFYDVILAALVYVVIVINLIELVCVCLRFGPSHELRWTRDITEDVCFVFQMIFTTAAMLLGVLNIDGSRYDTNEHWLQDVVIVYTVWISLFVIGVLAFFVYRIIESSRNRRKPSRQREKRRCETAVMISISLIAFIASIIFTTAINIGIFSCR